MPLISIVVLAYNIEQYVGKCLESLTRQESNDFEVIVINDGSTDSTIEIINQYANDSRLRVFNKSNGGINSARNCGLDRARGSYIIIFDGDDWVEPDSVSILSAAIKANPSTDLFVCDFYASENGLKRLVRTEPDFWYSKNYTFNKLVKRELFKHERFDEKILYYTDLELMPYLVLKAKRVSKIDKPLYNYRAGRRGSAVTDFNVTKFNSLFAAIERCVDRVENSSSVGSESARLKLGEDWKLRFYTYRVFLTVVFNSGQSIANRRDRHAYILGMAYRRPTHIRPDYSVIGTEIGAKSAFACFLYLHGMADAGDFILRHLWRFKKYKKVIPRIAK